MKKAISLILALISIVIAIPMDIYAEERPFLDVPADAWYTEYIVKAHEMGLIRGNDKGNMMPTKPLTRAEAVVLIYNQSGKEGTYYVRPFSDVPKNAWYINELNWAAKKNIVIGDGNNRFLPNDYITRQDFMLMLCRTYDYFYRYGDSYPLDVYDDKVNYKDFHDVSQYAKEAVQIFTSPLSVEYFEYGFLRVISADEPLCTGNNGYIMPKKPCTRAEAVSILIKMRKNPVIDYYCNFNFE